MVGRQAREHSRRTLLYVTGFAMYWMAALGLDSLGGGLRVQALVDAMTWAVLGALLWRSPASQRVLVLAVIVVATCFECVGSQLWGAYRYRYGNLPLYVPPGHGLFFLMVTRLAELRLFARHGRATVVAVGVGSFAWCARGVALSAHPDLVGAGCWWILLLLLIREPQRVTLALAFCLTTVFELYGTAIGAWHWAPILPGVGLPNGNPPSAIGAGYCLFEALGAALLTGRRFTLGPIPILSCAWKMGHPRRWSARSIADS